LEENLDKVVWPSLCRNPSLFDIPYDYVLK